MANPVKRAYYQEYDVYFVTYLSQADASKQLVSAVFYNEMKVSLIYKHYHVMMINLDCFELLRDTLRPTL